MIRINQKIKTLEKNIHRYREMTKSGEKNRTKAKSPEYEKYQTRIC